MRKPMRQAVGGACVIVTILNIVLNWLFYIRGTPPTLISTIWITIIGLGFIIYITLDYIFDYLKVERMNDTSKQCLFCEKINRNCFSIIRANINAAASALEIVNGIAELKSESICLHGENKKLKEEISRLKNKLEAVNVSKN
jgi:hypothetical protein